MTDSARALLRSLPSVEELAASDDVRPLLGVHSRHQVVDALRRALAEVREAILTAGEEGQSDPQMSLAELVLPSYLAGRAIALLELRNRAHLRRVLNATGVIVHTNLGRSVLAPRAIERVLEVAGSYSNLEYDLDAGRRGSRHDHVERLLVQLTGAEAAMVVNNNAAAVLLLLSALAAGREVVVSRGQLVEIGGSFRIPDIMRQSGARLVEVGTTNKTRIADYERAITDETGLLLRVHTSNFKMVGFTEEVGIGELAALGAAHGMPVADDVGSGALVDLPAFAGEPGVAESLRAGADLVTFSGDKLLGGPQAGVVVGGRIWIEMLKRHPLARALRVDKMTLAALEGTLLVYRDPERAVQEVPTLRFMGRTGDESLVLVRRLLEKLERACLEQANLEVRTTGAKAGGGALPLLELPSHAVALRPLSVSVVELEAALRRAPLPVVARVADDALFLDVAALDEGDLAGVAGSVAWALKEAQGPHA